MSVSYLLEMKLIGLFVYFTDHLKKYNHTDSCEFCGKIFKDKNNRYYHMKNKHPKHQQIGGQLTIPAEVRQQQKQHIPEEHQQRQPQQEQQPQQQQQIMRELERILQDISNVSDNNPDDNDNDGGDDDDDDNEQQLAVERKIDERQDFIKTFVHRKGRVAQYNFDVSRLEYGPGPAAFEDQLNKIYNETKGAFKINASLGLILRN